MKKCSKCGTSYDARIDFCFRDGTHLGGKSEEVNTPKMIPTSLAGVSDPTDIMQTLDNINIDDLLQIGSPTPGYSGFDFAFPAEAPPSAEGDTQSMSRSEVLAALTNDTSDTTDTLDMDLDKLDFELDQLSDDIDAHLEDTLDGVQVGQLLAESSLDMSTDSSEIQPGDTLDLIADELGLPEATESDVRSIGSADTLDDDFDQWEASGPVMQEAAREALKQRQQLHEDTETPVDQVVDPVAEAKSNRSVILFGVAAVVLGFVGVLVLTDLTSEKQPRLNVEPSMSSTTGQPTGAKKWDVPEPEYKTPVSPEGVDEPSDDPPEQQVKEAPEPNPAVPEAEIVKPTPEVQPQKPAPEVNPAVPNKKETVVTPKKPMPVKPKTYPKPMPKKDKADKLKAQDQGWGDQQTASVGWGDAESCNLTIRSNISAASVYVNGVKKGPVGKKIALDCTSYAIEVKADGYISTKRNINLVEDASFTMNLER